MLVGMLLVGMLLVGVPLVGVVVGMIVVMLGGLTVIKQDGYNNYDKSGTRADLKVPQGLIIIDIM